MEVIHPHCCGIDVHKESVVVCLRLHQGRRAKTEVRRFGTTTAELLRLHEWLSQAGCTHVAMESTSVYWKPVFNLLEGSFEVVLANAYHIKAVPGRKTDAKDCEWIADLLAHGLIRASFIPPPVIRDLRDLTRHRKSLVRDRVKATNRVHKLLETANIKLANVVSDVLGVSGRAMLDAFVAGETDPEQLAKLAKGSLIPKVKLLAETLRGRFTPHHAFLLGQMLTQLDQLAVLIARCDVRILEVAKPFEPEIQRLQTIVGVGPALSGGAGVRDRCGYVAVLDRWSSGLVGSHLSGQLRKRRQAPERQHGHGKQLAPNRAPGVRLGSRPLPQELSGCAIPTHQQAPWTETSRHRCSPQHPRHRLPHAPPRRGLPRSRSRLL
jgi:transposase